MDGGKRFLAGKYELIAPAGVGGMATVWRGIAHGENGFSRTVAIKRLLPWAAADREAVQMFVEEARLASELQHPNIAQVYDFCREDEDDRCFIVMEWVEGLSLGHFLKTYLDRDEYAPWPIVASIAIEILRALTIAHGRVGPDGVAAPVYHRDVTPTNVLLGVHGIAKLTDFGMARAMDRVTVTQPGVLKGKLSYMAPEYVGGVKANPRPELYAVGVILWEAFAGRKLREAKNPAELFAKTGTPVPRIREMRPDLPAEIAQVVDCAVERKPYDRYASTREMANALKAALRALDVSADEQVIGACVIEACDRRGPPDRPRALEESGEWPPPGSSPPGP
jgi:serine/threonine-protein kinase